MSFRPEGEIPETLVSTGASWGFLATLGMTDCSSLIYFVNEFRTTFFWTRKTRKNGKTIRVIREIRVQKIRKEFIPN